MGKSWDNHVCPLVNVYSLRTVKSPFCSWVNQLFLWPFAIVMLVYQRVDFKWWLEYFNWDCLFVYLCLPLSEKLDVQQEFGELES